MILSNFEKQTATCENAGREHLFEWSHQRTSATDSKVRVTLTNLRQALWQYDRVNTITRGHPHTGKWYRHFPEKNSRNSGSKVEWKENFWETFFENWGIPRETVLFFGNFGQFSSIRYWKLPKIKTARLGWMESASGFREGVGSSTRDLKL